MPKFGLKCFLGSFLLSLAAVFVATKAYLVMSLRDKAAEDIISTDVSAKNIELFASNEDNDPLYDKFNSLKNRQHESSADSEIADKALDLDEIMSDDALYAPDDETNSEEESFIVAASDSENEDIVSTDNDEDTLIIAENDITGSETDDTPIAEDDNTAAELQVVDASLAPVFKIPLAHNYNTGSADISVSNEADNSQVALASHNVAVGNLGTQNRAAVTDTAVSIGNSQTVAITDADDPWDVAETANKHVGKNSLDNYAAKHKEDVAALDKSSNSPAGSDNETKVAYKMQKNLLIPIPDEIMNDKNLTPQFSTSAENKKLEDELRANKTLPALHNESTDNASDANANNPSNTYGQSVSVDAGIPDLTKPDDETEESRSSKSLSESIAAWFSSSKPKSSDDSIRASDKPSSASRSNGDQSNSIFNKLLGARKSNVTPTELKLSFQPNRAEISGQTLEWIHAFADNAVKYENVVVEIRIDKSAPFELQQKRLRLLYRILANNGVDFNKINIIFTDREPNSFIIRNVRYATEEEKAKNVKTYNPWY